MEPGWSQREEGRDLRENEVGDKSAGSGGVKGQGEAARPESGIRTQASCFPVAQGPWAKEGRGKVEASAAVGGPGG